MSNPKEQCDIYQIDTGRSHTYFKYDTLRREATPTPHGRTQSFPPDRLHDLIATAAIVGITIRKI